MRTIPKNENPPYCCACYGQYPDRRHVDFEAAFDGPVLNREEVAEGRADAKSIEWLILCEDCLKGAAKEIGLVEDLDGKLSAREEEIEKLRARLEETERHAENLRLAVGSRPLVQDDELVSA